MKVATVLYKFIANNFNKKYYLESSYPLFIILKHKGIISVCIRKWIASLSSLFTKAPITPKLVTLRFSNGFALLLVLRKGYRNKGIWANNKIFKN